MRVTTFSPYVVAPYRVSLIRLDFLPQIWFIALFHFTWGRKLSESKQQWTNCSVTLTCRVCFEQLCKWIWPNHFICVQGIGWWAKLVALPVISSPNDWFKENEYVLLHYIYHMNEIHWSGPYLIWPYVTHDLALKTINHFFPLFLLHINLLWIHFLVKTIDCHYLTMIIIIKMACQCLIIIFFFFL